MLLKICYKPNGFYYVKDVASVDFDSHVTTDINVDLNTKTLYYKDAPLSGGKLLLHDDFVKENRGVCQHEEDGKMYINNISFYVTHTGIPTEEFIAFSGFAYLCDDSGKTIDVLK